MRKDNQLAKDMLKHGIGSFDFDVLEEIFDSDKLLEREKYWIKELIPEYNSIGNPNYTLSEKTREIIRFHATNQWNAKSDEEKQNIIMNNLKGRQVGYKHTDETKEKLRQANLGKKQSEETKEKRKMSLKSVVRTNENHKKKILSYFNGDFYREFSSIKEAGEFLKVNPSSITSVLKGRQKTAKGLTFKYKNHEQ
jgi:group I intron endonuclease